MVGCTSAWIHRFGGSDMLWQHLVHVLEGAGGAKIDVGWCTSIDEQPRVVMVKNENGEVAKSVRQLPQMGQGKMKNPKCHSQKSIFIKT